MKTRKIMIGLVSVTLLGGAAVLAFTGPLGPPSREADEGDEAGEQVINFDQAPPAVQTAALKVVGSAGAKSITQVVREGDENNVYEIEYSTQGVKCSTRISTTGDVMELEKGIPDASLPAAARAALQKHYPGTTFKDANLVQTSNYEFDVVIDGKMREILVDASGKIQGGKDEADEDGEHADGDRGRREKNEGKNGEEEDEDGDEG